MTGAALRMAVAPPLVSGLVRCLGPTLRLAVEGTEPLAPLWGMGRPLIYAVWHGRILMVPWLNARLRHMAGARPVRVLASRSSDGELVARYVRRFGLGVARGSSSRGGAAALRALAVALGEGEDVAVIPDGPRGPRGHAQPGVVALAALSGAPVVPMAFAAQPSLRLATWDEFMIPLPFARAAAIFGAPVRVDRDADRAGALKAVEGALEDVTAAADRRVRA
jgi:lysophospholipid acyltransferase (LPLAT)-like uncharacterized protein